MMDSILFGQKDGFAIELVDFNPSRNTGKFRLWVNGKPYGDLKQNDDLQDASDSFNTLLSIKDELYDDAFTTMTHVEVFSYCLLLDAKNDNSPVALFERMQLMRETYSLWFGEQLDSVAHVIYCKDGSFHFLLSYNDPKDFNGDFLRNLVHEQVPVAVVELAVQGFLLHLGS